MKRHQKFDFARVGPFELFEARRILPRLEQEQIRFRLRKDWSAIQKMDPVTADFGGTFGTGPKVTVWVHRGDQDKLAKILLEFFPV